MLANEIVDALNVDVLMVLPSNVEMIIVLPVKVLTVHVPPCNVETNVDLADNVLPVRVEPNVLIAVNDDTERIDATRVLVNNVE